MKYYVYLHRTADHGVVFYIGKGCRDRYKVTTGRSEYWNRIVAKHGFISEILAKFYSEKDAFTYEVEQIAKYKSIGIILANHTIGGEGASGFKQSEETKNKRNEKLRKKVNSPETIRKMRASQANKVIAKETRLKIAKTLTARYCGGDNPNACAVRCKETQEIYRCLSDAAEWLRSLGNEKASFKNVSAVLSGEKKTAYGYGWERVTA